MKTSLRLIIIAVLFLLLNDNIAFSQIYEHWSSPFGTESFVTEPNRPFQYQSDMYYVREVNSFSNSEFFTGYYPVLNLEGLLLSIGGSEGMDTGIDTSDNDHLYYANDVPLGDAILGIIILVALYAIINSTQITRIKQIKTDLRFAHLKNPRKSV